MLYVFHLIAKLIQESNLRFVLFNMLYVRTLLRFVLVTQSVPADIRLL